MKLSAWVATAFAVTVTFASASTVQAQFTPKRPLEIAVHAGPGSGNDVFARALISVIEKNKLSPVRIQVANKPGGGSTTAAAYLASKAGNENTLGVFTNIWITDPLVSAEATNPLTSMTPVALVIREPGLIAVKADSPYKTLQDFIDAAKAAPGKLSQSGGSVLARENVLRQLLMGATGADWQFISFPSGGERLSALLGGHVNMMIVEPGEATAQVRSGAMRVIAAVAEKRLPGFPDVPTLQEAGFNIPNLPQIRGIVAPPGMPKEAVAYYSDLIRKATETQEWKDYVVENGFEPAFTTPEETSKFITEYTEQLRGILEKAGIKLVAR
ncbi:MULTISPECIES: tripartite tricarboxylate transporter substrate binding protein [unclassified Chelatococcus]|uniref:Bug family tripartite tricarboxylate transporter substrate binding protein n=1 Tax=unclassified Chelatococcus TaxID=2638111 RepID=UPI001BCB7BEA|nr:MULTISPECIES: tripartite tricarboxylate transporter substrate binding protein [unclassified Chelatococcus]MBS7697224.1 tripartite tricarboxylate transporter substrate binding protein [Chelatococcus sp. YT9]MBX3556479.1 tripartite tricarboxylate transporter substrate binding protein [Chelatococcus sp.]